MASGNLTLAKDWLLRDLKSESHATFQVLRYAGQSQQCRTTDVRGYEFGPRATIKLEILGTLPPRLAQLRDGSRATRTSDSDQRDRH